MCRPFFCLVFMNDRRDKARCIYSVILLNGGGLPVGVIHGKAALLGVRFFVLVMVPGANRGVDKTAKKEKEADKKNNAGHSAVKPVSSSHTRNLCHANGLWVSPTAAGDADI